MNKTLNESGKENPKKEETVSIKQQIFDFIKTHLGIIILFVLTFLTASAIVFYDKNTSENVSKSLLEKVETKIGKVWTEADYRSPRKVKFDNTTEIKKDEIILENGAFITQESVEKIAKLALTTTVFDYVNFANSILFLMLIAAMAIILYSQRLLGRRILIKEAVLQSVLFILVFGVTTFTCNTMGITTVNSQDVLFVTVCIPAALSSFLVAILCGQRSALYFSLLMGFGVFVADRFQTIPAIFTIASSIAAFRIVRSIERRLDMVYASIFIAVLNMVFAVVLAEIFNESFTQLYKILPGVAFNGFISGIFVLGFLTPLESIMNTASVFRLMDLSDLNTPPMRKLLLTASGTYSHSMMVAQLSENACKKIGANSLVARVGAYYHDLGKMDHPEYFVENQRNGENKHAEINPSLSASVIKSHVKIGIEKARQLHLPQQILDIISEHHGNSVIAYFYSEAQKKDPNASKEDYVYPGNPPTTKESAVVMLADTVEAACRTLDKPSVSRLEKFIQQLFDAKIQGEQLENCALTFGELKLIRDSFVQVLAGYYHSRIEYPNQKDPDSKTELGEKTIEEAKNV